MKACVVYLFIGLLAAFTLLGEGGVLVNGGVDDLSKDLEKSLNAEMTDNDAESKDGPVLETDKKPTKDGPTLENDNQDTNDAEMDEATNFQAVYEEDQSTLDTNDDDSKIESLTNAANIPPSYKHAYSSINRKIFTSDAFIGYNAGSMKTVNVNGHIYGRVIKSIKGYYYNTFIRGIIFEYTNGKSTWSYSMGSSSGYSTDTFYFQNGEKVTTLLLYAVTHGTSTRGYFGGMYLRTNLNRTFSMYTLKGQLHGPYRVPVGSGVLISAVGRVSSYVMSFGFQLLRNVEEVKLQSLTYPSLSRNIPIKPIHDHTVTYDNTKGKIDQHYVLKGCKKVIEKRDWSYTTALESHFNTKVETALPVFAPNPSGGHTHLQLSSASIYDRHMEEEIDQCYEFPVTVPRTETITVSAVLYGGSFSTQYRGRVYYYLESGTSFYTNVIGVYSGIGSSKISAIIQ